jgi:glycosyltransferase involved in cell wall biosynthesis
MPVSGYVPCCNNVRHIAAAVESLRQQTVPIDDLMVIDDGSTDGSAAIAEALGARVIRHEQTLGRGAARARAMAEARHDLVVCCDATNTMDPQFVEQAQPWFADDRVAAVFGRVTQSAARTIAERWRGRHLFMTGLNLGIRHGMPLATWGAMVKRSATDTIGGYNPALRHTEDGDLGARLLGAGFDVVYDPHLIVVSIASNSVSQVLERHWRWYAGVDARVSWPAYLKAISYSAKVMVPKDLREHDWASAAISLLCPHHHFWFTVWRSTNDDKLRA